MSASAATITAGAVEGRRAPVPRYWVRRALAALCGLLFGLAIFTSPRKGLDLPGDWKEGIALAAALPAVVAMLGYAAGYRPRRGNWFWKTYAWGMLAWCIYEGYEATLVTPNTTDDVALALAILAGTAVFYPFIHLLFRFRAVGRLPEVPDAQPARGWKRWLGLRAERDVWSGAVPHPRWFQFGIAGPALVVTLWCVWLGLKVEQLRTQRETAARLQKQGVDLKMHKLSEWEEAVAPYLPRQLLVDVRSALFFSSDTGDEAIADLQAFRCLEEVIVDNEDGRYSDEAIRRIAGLSMLRRVDLRSFPVTDETLIALSGLRKLEELSFQSDLVTDRGIQAIATCPLTDLTMECEQVTDAGMIALGNCASIESLEVFEGKITDAGLAAIIRQPRLDYLSIGSFKINGSGFAEGADSSLIRSLTIIDTELNNDAIKHLSKLPLLTYLCIGKAKLTDDCAEDFRQFRALESILLSSVPVSDEVLLSICSLPAITEVRLYRTQIRGESLWRIERRPKLTFLELAESPLTDSGFAAALKSLSVPCHLSIKGTPVTDGAFYWCGSSTFVQSLDCSRTWITDAGIAQCRHFQPFLGLSFEWTLMTHRSLDTLTSMKQLNHLSVDGTPIGMMSDEELDKLFPDTIVYTGREGLE